jgi:hypothetical protein
MKKVTFQDLALEAEITTTLRTISQKSSLLALSDLATKETVRSMYRGCHQLSRSLHDTIDAKLLVLTNSFANSRGLINYEAEKERLQRIITVGEEKAIILAGYAKEAEGKAKQIFSTFLLTTICLTESVWNEAGFEKLFDLPMYVAYIISLVLGILTAIVAHEVVPRYVKRGESMERMKKVMAVACFIFLLFALMRMDRLPATFHEFLKVLAFTLISSIAFLVASLIGIRLWEVNTTSATKQEAQAAVELKRVRAEVEKAKADQEQLTKDTEGQTAYSDAVTEYGKSLKTRVINESYSLFYEYLKMAYNNRKPGIDPSIFDFESYPFPFTDEADEPTKKASSNGSIVAMVLLAFTFGFVSCTDTKNVQGDTAITVLVDGSTHLKQVPTPAELVNCANLDTDIFQSVRMEFGRISDRDIEPTYVHILEPAARWNSNLNERMDTVAHFEKNITTSLNKILPPQDAELKHSIVYRTVARHAVALNKMPYKRRILLVYSDLENHDGTISLYGKSGKKLLRNPEKLEAMFMEQVPLNNSLHGVDIYFVYEPADFSKNNEYTAVSSFFSDVFSRNGAITHITATTP